MEHILRSISIEAEWRVAVVLKPGVSALPPCRSYI
jgi:hypothetical protein